MRRAESLAEVLSQAHIVSFHCPLTDETQRVHGRNERQVLYATQGGPRYMLGVRYKF